MKIRAANPNLVEVVRCVNCQHCDNDVIVQKLKNGKEKTNDRTKV